MNKKRNIKNLISGVFFQILNTLMGLILPYLFITSFGSETNGLLSSVTQLYVCMELLEAGVGTSTIQALYGPIANRDKSGINGVLSATNIYYLRTGAIYSALIVIVALIYPMVIETQLPVSTVRLVVILQGLGHVINYFIQAKYKLLLTSEGKIYILNVAQVITTIIRNAGKIIVIYLGFGVILVQCVQLLSGLVYCMVITIYVKKRYKWINFKQKPNFKALNQKGSVLIQAVAWTVFNHTDTLLLTVIAHDLVLVSIYSVYMIVYSSVQNFLEAVYSSYQYGVGLAAQKSKLQLNLYYSKYRIFNMSLAIALYLIVYLFITPFLKIYTYDIKDADYLMAGLPILFFILKVFNARRALNKHLIEATGHFHGTQHIPVLETVINSIVSIALILQYKIYGVLIGTIVALVLSEILYIKYNSRQILDIPISVFWIDYLFFVPAIVIVLYLKRFFVLTADTYMGLLILAVPVSLGIVILFAAICFVRIKIDKVYIEKNLG